MSLGFLIGRNSNILSQEESRKSLATFIESAINQTVHPQIIEGNG